METRTLAEIETDIKNTHEALANVRGSETEVYARIVGYYRSVRNWNKGKREEYNQRKLFTVPATGSYEISEADMRCECDAFTQKTELTAEPVRYELFARTTCPNCPPVKNYLASVAIAGTVIDADTEAGMAQAAELGVFSAPTVIVYGALGTEIARAHSVSELTALFEKTTVAC